LVREALGPDFVRPFADRLEKRLGVDVVRVAELSTAYSFTIGGRPVIALPATGNWFRENWDIAHELGHLIKGHHDEVLSEDDANQHEAAANGFAAELLLPAGDLEKVDWDSVSDSRLADLVWSWGVSADALCRRLYALLGYNSRCVARWGGSPTQRLLRHHLPIESELDEITTRMDEASQRRFPWAFRKPTWSASRREPSARPRLHGCSGSMPPHWKWTRPRYLRWTSMPWRQH
jgi:hypothetical protein